MQSLPTELIIGLFDAVDDIVCFAKDREARYVYANTTLVRRLGLSDRAELLGRTAADVFPAPLGAHYLAQDRRVIAVGAPVRDEVERHLFPNHRAGWCVTQKWPVLDGGQVVGLVGISRDLGASDKPSPFARLADVLAQVREDLSAPIDNPWLAASAGVSVPQLTRYFREAFSMTPMAWVLTARLDHACVLLEQSAKSGALQGVKQGSKNDSISIAEIAYECGFRDHSAFSRAFKRRIGLAPSAYARVAAQR